MHEMKRRQKFKIKIKMGNSMRIKKNKNMEENTSKKQNALAKCPVQYNTLID